MHQILDAFITKKNEEHSEDPDLKGVGGGIEVDMFVSHQPWHLVTA